MISTRKPPLFIMGLVAVVLFATGWSSFHNRLKKSQPDKDEVLSASPAEIRLWFEQKPELKLSSITLSGPGKTQVTLDSLRGTDDPLSIAKSIPRPLAPGTYTVGWRTSGTDGHVIRGSFPFTIKP